MSLGKKKRKRGKVGRGARRRASGSIHDDDPQLDEARSREKILRGDANEGRPPAEPSRAELEGDVRAGLVTSVRGKEVHVAPADGGAPVTCLLRKSTRVPHGANALAVGDRIRYLLEGEAPYVLTEVEPRATQLARVRRGREEHVIAANVDVCVIVASAEHPPFKPRLVDRYLISAREGGLAPALVLNKIDLVDPATVPPLLEPYAPLGVPALAVSAETEEGMDPLRRFLEGKISVFSGQSGVGKTSLLNALLPDLDLKTTAVYGKAGKGRHTTTASTLYAFPFGGAVIDTPGLRSFLMHSPSLQSLHDFFPEIVAVAERCRFADCRHAGDAGCAVPDAIATGDVREDRLDSYRTLRTEIEEGG